MRSTSDVGVYHFQGLHLSRKEYGDGTTSRLRCTVWILQREDATTARIGSKAGNEKAEQSPNGLKSLNGNIP
jgi:hypothetical protein